jgi:hypothetical protein
MRSKNRLRVLVAAVGVAASVLALSAKPALADVTEGSNAAWVKTVNGDTQFGGTLNCASTTTSWSCSGNSNAPIAATGADCTQTVYVKVSMKVWDPDVPGCTAELAVPSWSGTPALAVGSGTFNFTSVLGTPSYSQQVTITASCTSLVGHASVTGAGLLSDGQTLTVNGALDWVGSCTNIPTMTWTGTVTIV